MDRCLPFWHESVVPALKRGKTVLITAHGNSIRGIVKVLDDISDDEITYAVHPLDLATTLCPCSHRPQPWLARVWTRDLSFAPHEEHSSRIVYDPTVPSPRGVWRATVPLRVGPSCRLDAWTPLPVGMPSNEPCHGASPPPFPFSRRTSPSSNQHNKFRGLEIPTGVPLVYHLDENLKPIKSARASGLLSGFFLGDPEEIKKVRGAKGRASGLHSVFIPQRAVLAHVSIAATPRVSHRGVHAPCFQAQELVANQSKLKAKDAVAA